MYTPKIYQDNDFESIRKFIQENGFGILVSLTEGQLWATHIPMMLSEDGTKLIGHMSRGNKQWKDFGTQEVMAIFSGPHTYISSSWYDHENVPTWNYLAIHIYGSINILDGDELYKALDDLTNKYEKASEKPISMSTMSPEYVKRAMKGTVGFEVTITRVEATKKLSQNRDDKNHEAIVGQLEKRGDHDSKAIAELMKANRCPVTHNI
jgi:transcriptional regulator